MNSPVSASSHETEKNCDSHVSEAQPSEVNCESCSPVSMPYVLLFAIAQTHAALNPSGVVI